MMIWLYNKTILQIPGGMAFPSTTVTALTMAAITPSKFCGRALNSINLTAVPPVSVCSKWSFQYSNTIRVG